MYDTTPNIIITYSMQSIIRPCRLIILKLLTHSSDEVITAVRKLDDLRTRWDGSASLGLTC